MYTREDLKLIEEIVSLNEEWAGARETRDTDPDYYHATKQKMIEFRAHWRGIRDAVNAGMGD